MRTPEQRAMDRAEILRSLLAQDDKPPAAALLAELFEISDSLRDLAEHQSRVVALHSIDIDALCKRVIALEMQSGMVAEK
jgi:predicted component of type VI protein secretion system